MRGGIGWALMALGAGSFLQAAGTPEEARLTIRIEKPDDTTTIRIPLSWMEVALDILKVLDEGRDTLGTSIDLDSLKAVLTSFRGGFLEVLDGSERVYVYVGNPEMRCPCLEITGRHRGQRGRVLVNLDVARNVLRHSEMEDLSPEERDRLLRFLDHPRLGESMEIVNTRGDTVRLRIVARPGGKK